MVGLDSFTVSGSAATFLVLSDGRARQVSADVTVQSPPWGSSAVVWQGGQRPKTLTLTVYLDDDDDLEDLESLVGESGTLVYPEGTFTAVLTQATASDYLAGAKQWVRTSWVVVS